MYSNVSLCTLKLQFLLIYFFYINNHSGQWWVVIKSFPIVGKGIILRFLNDLCWKNNESLVNWCKHWIKTVNIKFVPFASDFINKCVYGALWMLKETKKGAPVTQRETELRKQRSLCQMCDVSQEGTLVHSASGLFIWIKENIIKTFPHAQAIK